MVSIMPSVVIVIVAIFLDNLIGDVFHLDNIHDNTKAFNYLNTINRSIYILVIASIHAASPSGTICCRSNRVNI